MLLPGLDHALHQSVIVAVTEASLQSPGPQSEPRILHCLQNFGYQKFSPEFHHDLGSRLENLAVWTPPGQHKPCNDSRCDN